MAAQLHTVEVTADLIVRVPRDRASDLEGGVERKLARIDAVESIQAIRLTAISPRLNDLETDVSVDLTLALARSDTGAVRDTLAGAFHVDVDTVSIDSLQ